MNNRQTTPKIQKNNRHRALLLLGLLSAFGLRLFHLGGESLWYDETVSVALAGKSIPDLIAHTARDIHPPLYYLLLHGWQWLTQPTLAHGLEFLYAWPSLCFGMLIVALLYPVARRLLQRAVALLAVWLATVNPFHIWYSQEVRMYTLGGALGLLCLWALIKYLIGASARVISEDERLVTGNGQAVVIPDRWLLIFALSGVLGLYTLYYFLFLLVAFNMSALIGLWRLRQGNGHQGLRALRDWLGAQLLIVLLYTPWLPILWRQAIDPPVPGWRTTWTSGQELAKAISESLAALLIGQSPPGLLLWPWALVTILVIIFYGYTKSSTAQRLHTTHGLNEHPPLTGELLVPPTLSSILPVYIFVPILLIYLITLTVTPLYHVRYLFTYAPPFMIILAQGLWALRQSKRWLSQAAVALILLLNGWGLSEFWFNPLYRTDDHRTAVAQLAAQWRPGDLILVNAGWVYTVLTTYWPTALSGPDSALPPPIAQLTRMTNYAQALTADNADQKSDQSNQVIVARSGSVDGSPTLGWGDPDSDFYAMSAQASITALTQISDVHPRIWQYRLYDTVSDPNGLLRKWFDAHTQLVTDTPFPGRDFLRLQRYEGYVIKPSKPSAMPQTFVAHDFAAGLQLQNIVIESPSQTTAPESNTVVAGSTLYVQTTWSMLANRQKLPTANLSLRLYDSEDHLLAQQDVAPQQPTNTWQPGRPQAISLALPVLVATKPGDYALALVVYDQTTGAPLPTDGAQPGSGAIKLSQIHVQVAQTVPEIASTLASFDYIDLVVAQLAKLSLHATDALDIRLVWRPRANAYRDTYAAVLELHDAQGKVVQSWSSALGGWDYPSGQWPAGIPVQEWRQIHLESQPPAGVYQLTLRVVRSSDNLTMPAHQGWWPWGSVAIVIGNLTIE